MNDQSKRDSMQESKQASKQQATPESTTGVTVGTTAARPSSWKRLLAKKWVFPATYMAAAAIILTLMWVYQGSGSEKPVTEGMGIESDLPIYEEPSNTDSAVTVTVPAESMVWPVENRNEVTVVKSFYESTGTNEQKEAALIEYENTFIPNTGISLAKQDNTTFDVRAAMSGEVTRVEKALLIGNLVEITHENGIVTVYESLGEVNVVKGAEVSKGDVIATAGRNELEKELGVHLHFEIQQNGLFMNPEKFITMEAEPSTE